MSACNTLHATDRIRAISSGPASAPAAWRKSRAGKGKSEPAPAGPVAQVARRMHRFLMLHTEPDRFKNEPARLFRRCGDGWTVSDLDALHPQHVALDEAKTKFLHQQVIVRYDDVGSFWIRSVAL